MYSSSFATATDVVIVIVFAHWHNMCAPAMRKICAPVLRQLRTRNFAFHPHSSSSRLTPAGNLVRRKFRRHSTIDLGGKNAETKRNETTRSLFPNTNGSSESNWRMPHADNDDDDKVVILLATQRTRFPFLSPPSVRKTFRIAASLLYSPHLSDSSTGECVSVLDLPPDHPLKCIQPSNSSVSNPDHSQ